MTNPNLTIGMLSSQTDCSVPTIRYYEKIGLLPSPGRATNGHRYYRDDDLKRLTFIRRCRDFGFPIDEVRELVDLFEDGDRACLEVRDMAQARLDDIRAKLEEMKQLEASLASFVCSCNEACGGGQTRDCVIIDDLSLLEGEPQGKADGGCCTPPLAAQATSTLSTTITELKRL
ncbi:MerR family transcriptional regulator [Undibacterium pigrum]|uniref:MerR family transcriptional regulator n=1 Tax=Undibacterium pigrum TaxID=401470 RepID=A0A318JI45_9BURK|nr:helix-turn-helix domain-containing protein [Undibacterium pigrum]PXX47079.1 MerR family transcriptional regulator [Undibacterium pigrum]